jgi:SAM-dependent methyltransferase
MNTLETVGAAILSLTSLPKSQADIDPASTEWEKDPLSLLKASFPDFVSSIKDKVVLDYGCGYGFQSIAIANGGAKEVIGYDPNPYATNEATVNAMKAKMQGITFANELFQINGIDVIVSQDTFEHFDNPEHELNKMQSLLKPGGMIYLTFGPPWKAPWGAHMHFFCPIPWIQNAPLSWLFTERAVMGERSRFRDNKHTYNSVGLNKMTIKQFESILERISMKVVYKQYGTVWGMKFLTMIPYVREWFINQASVKLVNN